MIKELKQYISPIRKLVYASTGKRPWSYGYNDSRWAFIEHSINNAELLKQVSSGQLPEHFGVGFDERVAEYPWIFSRLSKREKVEILDAGSTFNFPEIISHPSVKNKQLTIFTYYPEPNNFSENRISYVYGDLREMPFKNNQFDEVVCQSTMEHVDMDNSIYGYELSKNENEAQKSYEYLKVVDELTRVLKPGGKLLLTFPYGKFENHGFFQQFDEEMVNRIAKQLSASGQYTDEYLLYTPTGWTFAQAGVCKDIVSHNPHTGKGKGTDGAAHCRSICCITFIKNN